MTRGQLFKARLLDTVNFYFLIAFVGYALLIIATRWAFNLEVEIHYVFMTFLLCMFLIAMTYVVAFKVIPDFIDYWFTGWKDCKRNK